MATISRDNIILELVAKADKFDQTLKDQDKKVSGFANTVSRAQKALIGFFAAKLSKDLVVGLFNAAAGLEQLAVKANTVFGDSLPKVTKAAQDNAIALGLTRAEYIASAAAIQDLLVPMGFARDTASNISIELTNLSGALAEWSGGQRSATEVADILTKALLGERESLKSLGISITEADVKTRLAEKGLSKLTGKTLEQAKAAATLELITEKSTDAQAAFAAGSDTLARRQAELSAVIRDTANNISNELLVVLQELTGAVDANELNQILQRVVAYSVASITFFKNAASTVVNELAIVFGKINTIANNAEIRIREFLGFDANQLRAETELLKKEVQRRIDARVNPIEEAQQAFEESLNRQQNLILQNEQKQTALQLQAAKDRAKVLSDEEKKALEKRKKEELEAQRNIEDLRIDLMKDAQEQAIARLETDTQRLIESLVGTPEQIKEQTELLKEVLKRELEKINKEFAELKRRISTFEPIQVRPLSEGAGVRQEDIDEQARKELEAAEKSAQAQKDALAQIADRIEAERELRRRAFDERVEQIEEITAKAIDSVQKINEANIRQVDQEIAIQQKRVDELNKIDSKATAEQIELEETRLAKLQTEREKFINQQRALAAAEIAINTAASIPSAIRAIIDGFQGDGGFLAGILKAATLATTIASTVIAIRSALSSVPSFAEGIERLTGAGTRKSDSIAIMASRDERIVPGDINERIGFDFKNKDLPAAVAFYKRYGIPGPSQDAINAPLKLVKIDNGEMLVEMKRMRKAFDAMRVEFNVSEDGIYAAVTKHQQKIDHQKALTR